MRRAVALVAVLLVPAAAHATPIGDAHRAIHERGNYRVVSCRQVTRTVVDCRALLYRPAGTTCQAGTPVVTGPLIFWICEVSPASWTPLTLRVHRGHVWQLPT